MKKKQLQSLLQEHRQLPRTQAQQDLARYFAEAPAEQTPQPTRTPFWRHKWVWVMAVCLVMVAVAVSLTVHYIGKTAQNEESVFYGVKDVETRYLDCTIAEFNQENKCQVQLPSFAEYESAVYGLYNCQSGKAIGIGTSAAINRDDILSVDVCAYINNQLVEDSLYERFDKTLEIDGNTIELHTDITDDGISYYLQWEKRGCVYRATVTCCSEVDIETLFRLVHATE